MIVSNLPATRFGVTITLSSQACGCEQLTSDEVCGHDDDYVTIASFCWHELTSDEVWRYDYVTITSLWLSATCGDTIIFSSRACDSEQLTKDVVWGHDYVTIKLVTVSKLPATRIGDTLALPSQACGCEQLTSDEI